MIISCGGEDLKNFSERAGRNASYKSTDAVFDFVEAIGTWVAESQLKRLHKANLFSLLADECTDVATIEELSICCRWVENVEPVGHFLEILRLKRADAQSIYYILIDCLKEKNIQINKLWVMDFDGAATFSGKNTGVQASMKNNSPHALFVHCHCHLLQLAFLQAANRTPGIKHIYTTLTTLWKFLSKKI